MQPTLSDGTVLDPKVLKVMKAIKTVEGGDYNNYTGDNGSSAGAFQWNNNKQKLQPGQLPARFLEHAREAGVQVNDFSPASQNKVAYSVMKKWKDEGLMPEEIAAKWNGAKKDPTTGRLTYVNPEYGNKFRSALMTGASLPPAPSHQSTLANQMPQQPQQLQENGGAFQGAQQFLPGLGNDLSGRLKDFTGSLSGATNAAFQGDLGGLGLNALHAAGSIGGALGDTFNRTLETVPGVLQAENAIGNTETMKGLGSDIQQFSQANPKTAQALGDVFNVASALPIVRSAKGLVNLGERTLVRGADNALTKEAIQELEHTAGNSKTVANLQKKGVYQSLVKEGKLPTIEENYAGQPVYNVEGPLAQVAKEQQALYKKGATIADVEKRPFTRQELASYSYGKITTPVQDSLDQLKGFFEKRNAKKDLQWVDTMSQKLDSGNMTLRDVVDLSHKVSTVGKDMKTFSVTGDLAAKDSAAAWENLRKEINHVIDERDPTGLMTKVRKQEAKRFNQEKALQSLTSNRGKKVHLKSRPGLLRKGLINLVGGAGEALGGSKFGITGALSGRAIGALLAPKPSSAVAKLASRETKSTLGKRVLKETSKGLVRSKAAQSLQQ